MDIGWGIDRGLQVLGISLKVYKAFKDSEENAPRQLRELAQEHETFHCIFKDLLEVLKDYNKPILIPCSAIQLTLDKCRLLLEKYSVLNEVYTKRTVLQGINVSFRTIKWALGEKLGPKIRGELAAHSRMLSLYASTVNLRITLEERVGNKETREMNREILLHVQGEKASNVATNKLEVPKIPSRPVPAVPEHTSQAGNRRSDSLQQLDTAYRELEALEQLLEAEERTASELDVPGHEQQDNTVDFIRLARNEVENQIERVGNLHKRFQSLPRNRQNTFDSAIADLSAGNSPVLAPTELDLPESSQVENASLNSLSRRASRYSRSGTVTIDPLSRRTSTRDMLQSPLSPTTVVNLQINLPESSHTSDSNNQPTLGTLPTRIQRSFNSTSRDATHYLDRFKAELADLARYDVDSAIANTRGELLDYVQRSFPPSPDLRLTPGSASTSSARSSVASSPPSINPNFFARSASFASERSRRTSLDSGQWKPLAKAVSIDDVVLACGICPESCKTALEYKHRESGGLSLRIICITNPNEERVLFRHDLQASIIYPHILHAGADPKAANTVRLVGPTKSLKVVGVENSHSTSLPIYRFADYPDDLDLFQQIVFEKILRKRWDIITVKSSAYTDNPKKWQTLRVWKNISGGPLVLMVHGKLVDKCDPFFFCETQDRFPKATSIGSQKAKVAVIDKKEDKSKSMQKRRESRDSTFSIESGENKAIAAAAAKVESLEFQFHNGADRDEFLKIWNTDGG